MARANDSQPPKWAYSGTDTTEGVPLYPLSSRNAPPALVVWLILTTNAGLAQAFNSDPPADVANAVKQISDAVNLTENCVSYLLSQYVKPTKDEVNDAAAVSKSFATVIESFHSIGGSLESPERYPPDECPELADILSLTSSLRNFAPEQDTDQ